MKNFETEKEQKLHNAFVFMCKAEGITCFLLYLIAMPLKYIFDNYIFMIPFGIIHGIFFTLYLLYATLTRKLYNWDDEDFVFVLLASLFPFATFWVECKYATQEREE